MKKIMPLFLSTLAMMAALPAVAQDKAVVARCGEQGCSCLLSAITPDEAALLYGLGPQPDPSSVLVVPDSGTPDWARISADEVDLAYGGDGQCEMQLFDRIVPKDGIWRGTVAAEVISGCPAAMVPALKTAVSAMVSRRQIDWGGAFHPDRLRDPSASASAFDWQDNGTGLWTGRGKFDQSSGPMGLLMRAQAQVLADDRISAGLRINVGIDGADATAQAILRSAGLSDCRVDARYDFRHDGN